MLEYLLNNSTIPLLQQQAIFGEHRQEVLAANIANIQTVGYKRQDLPVERFREAMQQMIAERQKQPMPASKFWPTLPGQPTATPVKTQENYFTQDLFQAEVVGSPNLTAHDDGNRSIEKEMADITKNLMTQNYTLELMRIQMDMLSKAISEQIS